MKIHEQILSNFPNAINKTAPIFSAITANGTNTGVMETLLSDIDKFGKEWTGTPELYEQTGDMLTLTTNFFSFFERFTDETEDALKLRLKAIFVRKGDTVWGTPFDVRNVFRQYFPSAKIYLIKNVAAYSESIVTDGDFQDGTSWELSDANIRNTNARFSKTYGIELSSDTDFCKQDINISQSHTVHNVVDGETYESLAKLNYGNSNLADYISNYNSDVELEPGITINIPPRKVFFLHWFLNGNCKVRIKDNINNKYWDSANLVWSSSSKTTSFNTTDWDDQSLFFWVDYTVTSITVEFIGEDHCYLDYVRLFEKKQNPSFTIIAHFEGNSTDDALALATGQADTDAETHVESGKIVIDGPVKFSNFGYFDGAFLTGVSSGFAQDLYEDLLQYVKAVGVKAYIEVINRDAEVA